MGRTGILVALCLWFAPQARAGNGVELPATEDQALWAPAFEFAGLPAGPSHASPHIHVEDNGAHWVLRAYDGQGGMRSAEVRAPKSQSDREQVALMASGLMRALSVQVQPIVQPTAPPAEVIIEDLDTITGQSQRVRRVKDGHKAAYMAPLELGPGVSTRPGARASGLVTIGARLTYRDNLSLDMHLGGLPQRDVWAVDADPSFASVDVDFVGLYRTGKYYSFGPMTGVSYRAFRQENLLIEQVIVPKLGAVSSLRLIGGRWWAFRFMTKGTVDLRSVEMIAATSRRDTMSIFDLQNSITFVIGNKVDPSIRKRTSSW